MAFGSFMMTVSDTPIFVVFLTTILAVNFVGRKKRQCHLLITNKLYLNIDTVLKLCLARFPDQIDQLIRFKTITRSGAIRSPNLVQNDHFFRLSGLGDLIEIRFE
jgi:hypothetical protein